MSLDRSLQPRDDKKVYWQILLFVVFLPGLSFVLILGVGLVESLIRSLVSGVGPEALSDSVTFWSMMRQGASTLAPEGEAIRFLLATGAAVIVGVIVGQNFGKNSKYSGAELTIINDRFIQIALAASLLCDMSAIIFTVTHLVSGSPQYGYMDYFIYLAVAFLISSVTWAVSRSRSELLILNRMNLGRLQQARKRSLAVYRVLWGELPRTEPDALRARMVSGHSRGWVAALILTLAYMCVMLLLTVAINAVEWFVWSAVLIGIYAGFNGLLLGVLLMFVVSWGRSPYLHRFPAIVSGAFIAGLMAILYKSSIGSGFYSAEVSGFVLTLFLVALVFLLPGLLSPLSGSTGPKWIRKFYSRPYVWAREIGMIGSRLQAEETIRKIEDKIKELFRQVESSAEAGNVGTADRSAGGGEAKLRMTPATTVTVAELVERQRELLGRVRLTSYAEFRQMAAEHRMTDEAWAVRDELDGIAYLLGEDELSST